MHVSPPLEVFTTSFRGNKLWLHQNWLQLIWVDSSWFELIQVDSSWLKLTRVDSILLYWVYILVGGPTASYISSNWFYTVGSLICIKSRGVVNYAKHGWAPFISSSHGWSFTKFVPIGGIKSRYRKMLVWQFEYISFNYTKHSQIYFNYDPDCLFLLQKKAACYFHLVI